MNALVWVITLSSKLTGKALFNHWEQSDSVDADYATF